MKNICKNNLLCVLSKNIIPYLIKIKFASNEYHFLVDVHYEYYHNLHY